jgi:hypothetical protein
MHTHTTHTATPWAYFKNDPTHNRNYTITDNPQATAQGIGVGTVVVANIPPISTTDHHEANAAFIVTACNAHHDLLEACKLALSEFEAYEYSESIDDPAWPVIQQLRAAIAKAKAGEE